MPIYHKLGRLPHTRHTVFEKPGGGLYYEQLFGTIGFEGMSSLAIPFAAAHGGEGDSGRDGFNSQNRGRKKH